MRLRPALISGALSVSLLLLAARADPIALSIPAIVVTCKLGNISWTGGTPPYSLEFVSPNFTDITTNFDLAFGVTNTSFAWLADFPAGAVVDVIVTDAAKDTSTVVSSGGRILVVAGADTSCLNATNRHAVLPQATTSTASTQTAGASQTQRSGGSLASANGDGQLLSALAISAAAVAGLVVVLMVGGALCVVRRRRKKRRQLNEKAPQSATSTTHMVDPRKTSVVSAMTAVDPRSPAAPPSRPRDHPQPDVEQAKPLPSPPAGYAPETLAVPRFHGDGAEPVSPASAAAAPPSPLLASAEWLAGVRSFARSDSAYSARSVFSAPSVYSVYSASPSARAGAGTGASVDTPSTVHTTPSAFFRVPPGTPRSSVGTVRAATEGASAAGTPTVSGAGQPWGMGAGSGRSSRTLL
ncbi:uncharacterized protein BXZ73DRAFT_100702 [Epithele typhae]|uniref:uncharacterized protein n=1 Tax=Epithele typhae TaxID=378194 RepID=UPI00200821A4|nr:uncharacterized protein BXZ73DRAFT_100702 [Epithele typhae]KAH9934513.1 hypothetical protein BXZ73DRAFT_100702 [Epithele typhae]